jgi:exopolysaccharide production protein ExoZ
MQAAWPLQDEVLFYGLFAVMIISSPAGSLLLAVWGLAYASAGFLTRLGFPWAILLSTYNVLFIQGIAAALNYHRLSLFISRISLILGALIFFQLV